jgi:Uma2 family endonuclease
MSIATDPTTEQLIAELYKVEGKAEIVNGRIELMSPTGEDPGRAGGAVFVSLRLYEKEIGGVAFPDNVGFLTDLPHRKSFCPDAAYYTGPRTGMKFPSRAPDFAVEVRSEGDYGPSAEREIAAKRADYFAAGTKVVWDVDLLNEEVIRVYRSDNPGDPKIYRRGETAEAEPAVPGWTFQVDELFE